MSNLDSKYIINLDLMQDTKNNTMHFNLSDSETSDFWINITRYGVDINEELLDKTVTLYVIKPNKNVEFGNISYDSTEKMYYCNLSSEFKNIKGNYTAQVVIYDSSTKERKVTRSKFKYYVEDDILSDASGTVNTEEQENILDDIISRLAALEEGGSGTSATASNISITDTGNYFTNSNVEGALQEVGSQIKDITKVADLGQNGNNVYIKDSDGNKVGNGITIQASSSESTIRPLKTVNMGEIFNQVENYTAWFQGCLKYDEEIGCPVAVISGKGAHTTGAGKCYFFKIEPKTGEVTLSIAGQYDDEDTYGCFSQSFYIDNDGNYNFYASIHQASGWDEVSARKYMSTDKGVTWSYTDVTGTTIPTGSIIKLKSGRLIGLMYNSATSCVRAKVVYSDDNGENWTEGYAFSGSTEVEIIELKDCLIAIGRKNLTYTSPLPAVLYYSTDEGKTWTAGVESTTLTDMCNPCSGVYWENDELLELFYCSRASNNGNTGTIYHSWAKLEDAKNDNFTVEAIGESKQTEIGIDFGYCSTACNQDEKAWVIYYDKANSGSGVNLNLILCDKTCVTLPVSNSTNSLISLYSSKTIETKLKSLRSELLTKLNEVIINGGGSVEDSGDGTLYITDGLAAYWDFTDDTNYDSTTGYMKSKVSDDKIFIASAYNAMDTPATIDDFSIGLSNPMSIASSIITANPGFSIEINFNITNASSSNTIFAGFNTSTGFYSSKNNMASSSVIYNYLDTSSSEQSDTLWTSTGLLGNAGLVNVIITFDTTGIKVYKNSTLDCNVDFTDLSSYVLASHFIMRDGRKLSCRIYNKVLSQDEITNNYTYESNKFNL